MPGYLTAVTSGERVFAYLERSRDARFDSFGLELDQQGGILTPLTPLVGSFQAPFGEVLVSFEGLTIAVVRQAAGDEMLWELWRWSPPDPAAALLRCTLPSSSHGQLVSTDQGLTVFLEDSAGSLLAFSIDGSSPSCPQREELVTLATSPLPDRYTIDHLPPHYLLAGRSGDSLSVRIFGEDLNLLSLVRLAAGSVVEPTDLLLFRHPDRGLLAVFNARPDGPVDLYLADLDQLSAGSPPIRRIVATADRERRPFVLRHGEIAIVGWAITSTSTWETVLMASPLRWDGTVLRGGEILWRTTGVEHRQWTALWTSSGLLRLWIDPATDGGTLHLSLMVPSFW
ncbi:MAG: hypothetical protein JW797_12700 [Bradymonadales bacterium]|nr:hypothetical protein [Bradymonadales bacterium]